MIDVNYIKSITEALLLMEMPHVNKATTKNAFSKNTAQIPTLLSNIHNENKSTHLGNDRYYRNFQGTHVYYHLVDDKPEEYSVIKSDHEQNLTSKVGGDSSHNISFMKHHVNEFGKLNTSLSQTDGSKHLWQKFIKTNPDIKFHSINGGVSTKITPETNLDDLWSEDGDSVQAKTIISASK
jgi:hypothetical protein